MVAEAAQSADADNMTELRVRIDASDPTTCAHTIVATAYQAHGLRAIQFWQEEFWR